MSTYDRDTQIVTFDDLFDCLWHCRTWPREFHVSEDEYRSLLERTTNATDELRDRGVFMGVRIVVDRG